ncbi:hypothetical protein LTR08_003421 [Meristemomyces frigidus]|nr:hypothetical protein LTR08_003421 [Meristemomyces frigidus]
MFATPHFPSSSPHASHLPPTPSPLSPRSANIYGRRPVPMSSDAATEKEGLQCRPPMRFTTAPVRPAKKALVPGQDELKERRRGMFLRKVKEGREDKRWESRGEDMMRLDFVQRQRKWEAEKARAAPRLHGEMIEEDDMEDIFDFPSATYATSTPATQQQLLPDDELDTVLQRENEELEALISSMPLVAPEEAERTDTEGRREAVSGPEEHMWSDDDDYEAMFSDYLMAQSADATQRKVGEEAPHPHDPICAPDTPDDGEEMDMS